MEESKVKTVELYAASDSEKQSLIDWYQNHSNVELHDEGINTLVKICPPEEYGEDDDCEELQNVMRVMFYRLTQLEARNKDLEEALRQIKAVKAFGRTFEIAEQALNKK